MDVLSGFEHLSTRARIMVLSWLCVLCGFYAGVAYFAGTVLFNNKIESAEHHEARVAIDKVERGRTGFDVKLLNGEFRKKAKKVEVGIYLDRVINLSTKAAVWTADFYIWFRWKDEALDPGNTFQVVGGEVINKIPILHEKELLAEGKGYYALYRVTARITKYFNIMRYPLDNHLLTIHIEESKDAWHDFQYDADYKSSDCSSRVRIPGYNIAGDPKSIVKPHSYKSNKGYHHRIDSSGKTYSQFVYGLAIQRPDWGLYFKMFQGSFASVAIAFIAFLFRPGSGERVRLGVGAFFASVASSYVNLGQLPGVTMVTMTDMMNGLVMASIFLSICSSVINARLASNTGYMAAAEKFDNIMLSVFVAGFVGVNVIMAQCASIL